MDFISAISTKIKINRIPSWINFNIKSLMDSSSLAALEHIFFEKNHDFKKKFFLEFLKN